MNYPALSPHYPELSPLAVSEKPLKNSLILFSLIIPTYNESQTIVDLLEQLCAILENYCPGGYEVVVVDDDSPDRTWQKVAEFSRHAPQVRLVRRCQEKGLATAVVRGWQVARGSVLGVMDGDLQHPPEVVARLLGAVLQGADLAVATRYGLAGNLGQWSWLRQLLSRGAQGLGWLLLPQVVGRVTDPLSGYFVVRRSAIAQQVLKPLGYKILIEVLARGRIQAIEEVGYGFQNRQGGKSKVTPQQFLSYGLHLLRLRWSLGMGFLRGRGGQRVSQGFQKQDFWKT